MRKIWSPDEENFIRNNISSITPKEFAAHFDVSYTKIIDKIHKMGLNSKKARNIIWSQKDDQLLSEHFEYAPKDYLLRLFPCRTWNSIVLRGERALGLVRHSQDKKYLNYKFFDRFTPESAYFFGFILADGHIIKKPGERTALQIEVGADSEDILRKLVRELSYEGKVSHLKSRNTYKVCIGNMRLVEQLIVKGIPASNKTFEAVFNPEIFPKDLLRDAVRGIVDGDGWSYIDGTGTYNLGLCGTEKVVSAVKKCLPIDTSTNKIVHYEKNCWRFNLKGKKALAVAKWLYDDASVYLDKKYSSYQQACQDKNSPSYGKPCEDRM